MLLKPYFCAINTVIATEEKSHISSPVRKCYSYAGEVWRIFPDAFQCYFN